MTAPQYTEQQKADFKVTFAQPRVLSQMRGRAARLGRCLTRRLRLAGAASKEEIHGVGDPGGSPAAERDSPGGADLFPA